MFDRNARQIEEGWNVYGSDDAKVGDVAEVGSNYLLVQKGWLFTRDIYIPLSAIASVQENDIRLNVTKDEVVSMPWDTIPAEDATTTTYGTGTTGRSVDRTVASTTTDRDYIDDADVVETDRTVTRADTDRTVTRADTRERDTDEVRIPVVEEEVRVGKRETERGGVRVTTHVEETPVNEQVTLREEHVHVDRQRVDRPASEADLTAVREDELEVRTRREEAVVDKQARIVEEVVVGKDVEQRTETIQDSVRRTDVDVQEVPGETRTRGYTETTRTSTRDSDRSGARRTDVESAAGDEGAIERGLSKAGNAAERATGLDLDRDRDVGNRDPRNNV